MRGRSGGGFSLPELLVVCAVFAGFLVMVFGLLQSGMGTWHQTSSSQDTHFQLNQASSRLMEELSLSSVEQMDIAAVPHLPGTEQRAIWFLSAIDPATGEFARTDEGEPLWQRNVIYYLAQATDHDTLFGVKCDAADTRCPHKFLIRRVVDAGPATAPDSAPSSEERLMTPAQVLGYLKQPTGHGLSLARPTAEKDELIAQGLLDLQIVLGPDRWPDEVMITISGFSAQEAGKKFALGRQDLKDTSYTHTVVQSCFPGNLK